MGGSPASGLIPATLSFPSHPLPPPTPCLESLRLPQERHASQGRAWRGNSASPCSVPSSALGQHNTHKNEEALSTHPGLMVKLGGASGFTTVKCYSIPKNGDSGTGLEKRLPIHPTAASRSIPEQSNKSRPQSWQSRFQHLDWVKGFKPSLPECLREIWAPFRNQRPLGQIVYRRF